MPEARAGVDSDLDLLVLFDDLDVADRRRLMGRIRTAIDAPVPIDVLVAEVSEFEADNDVRLAYYWPAKDGHISYERPPADRTTPAPSAVGGQG